MRILELLTIMYFFENLNISCIMNRLKKKNHWERKHEKDFSTETIFITEMYCITSYVLPSDMKQRITKTADSTDWS